MKRSTKNLLIIGGLGALAYYLYNRQQAQAAAAALPAPGSSATTQQAISAANMPAGSVQ